MKYVILFLLGFFPNLLTAQVEYVHSSDGGDSEFVSAAVTDHATVVVGSTTEKYSYTSRGLLLELNEKGDLYGRINGDQKGKVVLWI
ncbi:MAG: hypothetical protein AAGF85_10180 [Bacteroidota bacterium]